MGENLIMCRVCLTKIKGNDEFNSINNVRLKFETDVDIENAIVCHKCKIEDTPNTSVIKKENEEIHSQSPPLSNNNDEIFMEKIKEEFIVDAIKTEDVVVSDCEFDSNVSVHIDESSSKVLGIAADQIQKTVATIAYDDSDIYLGGRASLVLNKPESPNKNIQKQRQKTKKSGIIEKTNNYYKLKRKYYSKKLELAKFELKAKKELYAYEVKAQQLDLEIKKIMEVINKTNENV